MTVDHRVDSVPFIIAHFDPAQEHRITKYLLPHWNSYRWLAGKSDRSIGLRQNVSRKRLQPDSDSSESNLLGSPGIGKAQTDCVTPQIGFYNQAQRLVVRPVRSGIGKGEVNQRRSRTTFEDVLGSGCPGCYPFLPRSASFLSETWMGRRKRGCHEGSDGERK